MSNTYFSCDTVDHELWLAGSHQRIHALSKNQIDIQIDGISIKKVEEAKSLGLFIDKHLSWTKHIEEISKKISYGIGALKRIRPLISESTALQIYQALILPHFDYCSPVWDELSVLSPPQRFKRSLYQSAVRSVPQAQSRMDRSGGEPRLPRFPPSPVTLCLHLHYSADPPHPKKNPLSLCGGESLASP